MMMIFKSFTYDDYVFVCVCVLNSHSLSSIISSNGHYDDDDDDSHTLKK